MDLMNRAFRPYLDKFIIILLHDVPVCASNEEEDVEHLKVSLQILREHRLYAKFPKCDFWMEKM